MIQLDTLGTVDLRRDGAPVRSILAQPRRLALLVYLATSRPRGFHSRERVMGLFWPDADQERARNSLRQALHQLRRGLGDDVLVARGDRDIGIDPSLLACDAVAFDLALEAGQPEQALRIYRGEFLPGFFLDGAPEAERFIEDERARYRRAAVAAAWQLAGAAEATGDLRAAVTLARQATGLDPHDEAGLRRAVSLLAWSGEPASALQLYEEFARRLKQDLELLPSSETLDLVERLRAGDRPPPNRSVISPSPGSGEGTTAPAPSPVPSRVPPQASAQIPAESSPIRRIRAAAALAAVTLVVMVMLAFFAVRRPPADSGPPTDEASAIAVLPFVNLSGDPANEYLSDGIAEELIYALSRIPRLNVVGHTSSFAFKGKEAGLDAIARSLRVGHVLEGSVRVTPGRVRIVATLINARSGYQVWSETYDGELDDVLEFQSRISHAIAGALHPRLAGSEPLDSVTFESTDPEAHADVLRGLQAWRQGGPDDYTRAGEFFRRAIERDSGYARAHAGLAVTLMTEALLGTVPRDEGNARATASARRALALNPGLADAHGVLGRIAQDYQWDYDAADRHFLRAIEASPGAETWYRQRGRLLSVLRRHDEAIALARRSVLLDPLAPGAHRYLGLIYYHARQYDSALAAFRRESALLPDNVYSLAYQSYVLNALGRHAESIQSTEHALTLAPDDQIVLAAAAAANAAGGDTGRARVLERRMMAQPRPSAYLLAEIGIYLDSDDRIFELLDRAVAERDPFLQEVRVVPSFDRVRADPRMGQVMRRLGFDR